VNLPTFYYQLFEKNNPLERHDFGLTRHRERRPEVSGLRCRRWGWRRRRIQWISSTGRTGPRQPASWKALNPKTPRLKRRTGLTSGLKKYEFRLYIDFIFIYVKYEHSKIFIILKSQKRLFCRYQFQSFTKCHFLYYSAWNAKLKRKVIDINYFFFSTFPFWKYETNFAETEGISKLLLSCKWKHICYFKLGFSFPINKQKCPSNFLNTSRKTLIV